MILCIHLCLFQVSGDTAGTTNNVEPILASINRYKWDHNGDHIGEAKYNPIVYTQVYQVEFPTCCIEEYGKKYYCQKPIFTNRCRWPGHWHL